MCCLGGMNSESFSFKHLTSRQMCRRLKKTDFPFGVPACPTIAKVCSGPKLFCSALWGTTTSVRLYLLSASEKDWAHTPEKRSEVEGPTAFQVELVRILTRAMRDLSLEWEWGPRQSDEACVKWWCSTGICG